MPAFAYGDPSGGYFFQILTPFLAMLWGFWFIFAGAIRKGFRSLLRRIGLGSAEDALNEVENAEEQVEPVPPSGD